MNWEMLWSKIRKLEQSVSGGGGSGSGLPMVDLSAYPVDLADTGMVMIEGAETIATLNKLKESAPAVLVKIALAGDVAQAMVVLLARFEQEGMFGLFSGSMPPMTFALMPTAEEPWVLQISTE